MSFPISESVKDAKPFEPTNLRREEIESSFIVDNWINTELFSQQGCVVGSKN